MISHIVVVIMLRLIREPLLMVQIMVIWHSPVHQPGNIVVAEGQKEVVLCFSSFQQIMEKPLSIKL